MEIRQALAGLTLALILGSGVAAADFDKGFKAYESWDFKTALAEFTPLAEQGHAEAQHYLAIMYADGTGVFKDDVKAYMWNNIADYNGAEHGRWLKTQLAKKITSTEIIEAQDMSSRCLESIYTDC
jgi:hypothetical protein